MSANLDGAFLTVMAVKDEMLRREYGRIKVEIAADFDEPIPELKEF